MGQTLNNQQINQIKFIAFNFDSQNYQLSDISDEVKGELNGYLANKQLINQWEFFVQASENYSKVNLMIDNDRDTFWQSNLPYDKQQIIEFNLQSSKKVAQISIDSYNDKNQGKIGYEIYLSDNGQEWDKVFTAKQYPPNDQGIVNIYFQPKMSRYVKIKQIGTHQFASWVINEIKLYETTD